VPTRHRRTTGVPTRSLRRKRTPKMMQRKPKLKTMIRSSRRKRKKRNVVLASVTQSDAFPNYPAALKKLNNVLKKLKLGCSRNPH
jgi:hypothetical protein